MSLSMIIVSCPSDKVAEKISKILLQRRLAACCQISGPIQSWYVWKEKTTRSSEHLLFIKTRKSLFSRVTNQIRQSHPYEVPEILQLPVTKALAPYAQWVLTNTTPQ